jgi:hypothetical protein
MKAQSPQVGFNNNIRHAGRLFHVQTEDSGVARPHVITHLFADGGRILKTKKTSYAEFVEEHDLTQRVRTLMKEQHKAMLIALRDGEFDSLFVGGAEGPLPPPTAAPASNPEPALATSEAATDDAGSRESPGSDEAAARVSTFPPSMGPRSVRPSANLELDLDSLARATEAPVPQVATSPRPPSDLPPPPARVRRSAPLTDTLYRSVTPQPTEYLKESRASGAPRVSSTGAPPPPASASTAAPNYPAQSNASSGSVRSARYAPPREPSIFEPPQETRAPRAPEPIDARSLDEVILSYLAEEERDS